MSKSRKDFRNQIKMYLYINVKLNTFDLNVYQSFYSVIYNINIIPPPLGYNTKRN